MRNVLVASALAVLMICPAANATSFSRPNLNELRLAARLPAELPQRVTGLAYDGQRLWTTIYHGRGQYAILDPSAGQWEISQDQTHHRAIAVTSGSFASPGAICFVNGKLWIAGSYGDSFGSIDLNQWTIESLFEGRQRRGERASQSYASMAHDGTHLWFAWHLFRYNLPVTETQLLLKVDPETGKVVTQFPAPAGTRNDGTHGLTWDGSRLWHVKDKALSAIDPATGNVTARYTLPQLKRPSGLAWDGEALWISEFDGKIWHLPF